MPELFVRRFPGWVWNEGWLITFAWRHEKIVKILRTFAGRLHGPKLLTERF